MTLTIAYITSRVEPKIEWFFDSLAKQQAEMPETVIVVDHHADDLNRRRNILRKAFAALSRTEVIHTQPKPTIWQGKHRITKVDWWAKSNAHNTAICLCRTDWIAFVDDRSVLGPKWLERVHAATESGYAVCGNYEKHANLQVNEGVITGGELLGKDTRTPGFYKFDSWYGGSMALPLEWALAVQGYPEVCDGLGSEDSMFGVTLRNSGYPIMYDSEMLLIEDRTPGEIEGALKRADKNPHLGQQAKSWAIVRMFQDKTTSQNEFDIRNMRERVLNGEPFPPPTGPRHDFYDGQPIEEME